MYLDEGIHSSCPSVHLEERGGDLKQPFALFRELRRNGNASEYFLSTNGFL